jgi:5-methylcytosine-specific restriction endonuclease McrA
MGIKRPDMIGWTKGFMKGFTPWNKGTRGRMKAWNRGLAGYHSGENNGNWRGGVSKVPGYDSRLKKRLYATNPEYRFMILASNRKRSSKGKLTYEVIKLVYEDNIKRYGTLTCYLCENPITFKKDHLEHKTPLSRGGTHEYNNLAVACQKCNLRKNSKTETEYREVLK